MVVIRLAKSGAKKNPYFFITVADSRMPRDGRFIERLGFYNPSARGSEERLRFNTERFDHWVGQGAQVSDRVKVLHQEAEMSPEDLAAKFEKRDSKRQAKKEAKEEINEILVKLETQKLDFNSIEITYKRLMSLNKHVENLFKIKSKELSSPKELKK